MVPIRSLGLAALAALAACGRSPSDPSPGPTPFPPGDPGGAAPYLVRDINAGPSSARPTQLVGFGGILYFTATDAAHGAELWATDGTAAGTRLVRDICPGTCSSNPADLRAAHGRLYFAAAGAGGEPTAWISDGTEAGTREFLPPGAGVTTPSDFVALGPHVIFIAASPDSGRELWRTDGIATTVLADVVPGAEGGLANNINQPDLFVAGGQLFFVANDRVLGQELWRSDGSREGTRLVRDVLPGQRSGVAVFKPAVHQGLLYFAGDDGGGRQLFRSDGTLEGTLALGAPVNDLFPSFRTVGDALLFAGGSGRDSIRDQLWRSDGTRSGTAVAGNVDPDGIMEFQGAAFFHGWTGAVNQAELWRSDGSPTGTALFKEIREGIPGSNPQGLSPYRDWLFLAAEDGARGMELWRSDGTPQGTTLVADINPGPGSAFIPSYPAGGLVHGLGDRVYFIANDGSSGEELWAYRVPPRP